MTTGLWNRLRWLAHLADNYGLSRLTGRPSLRGFWYTPDRPAVFDAASRAAYLAAEEPFYLIDYRPKLGYSLVNADDIIVLPYPHPIGRQINPEAAFQYALGLHDEHLATGDPRAREAFLHYASYFAQRQTATGDWTYDFDWFRSSAGWTSALAQARGASVMIRAARLTGDATFAKRALRSMSRFGTPLERGGYLATLPGRDGPLVYFEEYPQEPTAVLNGFLAALFGLYEVATWLGDAAADRLFTTGLDSLEEMIPRYLVRNWSLYSLDRRGGRLNYDSPHYHELTTNYLSVIAAIDPAGGDRFSPALGTYRRQGTAANAVRYTIAKVFYKLFVR